MSFYGWIEIFMLEKGPQRKRGENYENFLSRMDVKLKKKCI